MNENEYEGELFGIFNFGTSLPRIQNHIEYLPRVSYDGNDAKYWFMCLRENPNNGNDNYQVRVELPINQILEHLNKQDLSINSFVDTINILTKQVEELTQQVQLLKELK